MLHTKNQWGKAKFRFSKGMLYKPTLSNVMLKTDQISDSFISLALSYLAVICSIDPMFGFDIERFLTLTV